MWSSQYPNHVDYLLPKMEKFYTNPILFLMIFFLTLHELFRYSWVHIKSIYQKSRQLYKWYFTLWQLFEMLFFLTWMKLIFYTTYMFLTIGTWGFLCIFSFYYNLKLPCFGKSTFLQWEIQNFYLCYISLIILTSPKWTFFLFS